MKTSLSALILGGALALTAPAQAHDLWLEAGPAGTVLAYYGHPGDISAPDKARLFDLVAVTKAGKAVAVQSGFAPAEGALAAPLPGNGSEIAIAAARLDNGFWSKTPQGFRNTGKLNAPDAVSSMWSQKFAKTLLPGHDAKAYATPVGHRLEIVPLADPFRLKAGDVLAVRVDYEGKPLAGAELAAGDGKTKVEKAEKAAIATDANGIARIAILQGSTIVTTSHKAAGSVPAMADRDSLSASLEFATK